MAPVNEVFQSAPMGRRVVLPTVFTAAFFVVSIGVNMFFTLPKMKPHTPVWKKVEATCAPFGGALVTLFFFLRQRSKVSEFKIEENELVLGSKKYPLQGVTDVYRDRGLLKGARRVWGNGGLGAITGFFRSKKLGKFHVFMTGTENAVVVLWPDKAVAVSPADPEFFIFSAQKAAGLR